MACEESDHKDKSKILHWHTVYKLSSVSSPTIEENVSVFPEDAFPVLLGKRLSLLCSNMQAEKETMLRSFLTTKLNKSEELNFESFIQSIEPNYFVQDVPSQIYYKVITTRSNILSESCDENKFLVCFVASTLSGLELYLFKLSLMYGRERRKELFQARRIKLIFKQKGGCLGSNRVQKVRKAVKLYQKDLDVYSDSLLPYLEKYNESVDISEYLQLLDSWFETNICFVERSMSYFGEKLAILIAAGYRGDAVVFDESVPEDAKSDILRFVQCCNLSQYFMESNCLKDESISSFSDLVVLSNSKQVSISVDQTGQYYLNEQHTSSFCLDCVKSMQSLKSGDPIKMRQFLENYKLKCIQDMNTFKRYLKQAETDYYTLYKSYVFLITSGNGDVILQTANMQNMTSNTLRSSKKLVDILEHFIHRNGGFQELDKSDFKEKLRGKLSLVT